MSFLMHSRVWQKQRLPMLLPIKPFSLCQQKCSYSQRYYYWFAFMLKRRLRLFFSLCSAVHCWLFQKYIYICKVFISTPKGRQIGMVYLDMFKKYRWNLLMMSCSHLVLLLRAKLFCRLNSKWIIINIERHIWYHHTWWEKQQPKTLLARHF